MIEKLNEVCVVRRATGSVRRQLLPLLIRPWSYPRPASWCILRQSEQLLCKMTPLIQYKRRSECLRLLSPCSQSCQEDVRISREDAAKIVSRRNMCAGGPLPELDWESCNASLRMRSRHQVGVAPRHLGTPAVRRWALPDSLGCDVSLPVCRVWVKRKTNSSWCNGAGRHSGKASKHPAYQRPAVCYRVPVTLPYAPHHICVILLDTYGSQAAFVSSKHRRFLVEILVLDRGPRQQVQAGPSCRLMQRMQAGSTWARKRHVPLCRNYRQDIFPRMGKLG